MQFGRAFALFATYVAAAAGTWAILGSPERKPGLAGAAGPSKPPAERAKTSAAKQADPLAPALRQPTRMGRVAALLALLAELDAPTLQLRLRVLVSSAEELEPICFDWAAMRLAELDPQLALELLDQVGSGPVCEPLLNGTLRVLVATAPELAGRWLAAQPSASMPQAEMAWRRALVRLDPKAAIDRMHAANDRNLTDCEPMIEAYERLAMLRGPEAARQGARSILAACGIAKAWARLDPAAAVAWAAQESEKVSNYTPMVEALSALEPAQAAAYALAHPSQRPAQHALDGVMSRWAAEDFNGALAWMLALPPGEAREIARRGLGFEWVARDPEAAMADALRFPQRSSIHNAVQDWAILDFASLRRWVQNLPSGPERAEVLQSVVMHECQWGDDPRGIVGLLQSMPDLNPDEQSTLLPAIGELAQIDFPGALAAARGLPAEALQESAFAAVIEAAAASDPLAMSELLTDWVRVHPNPAGLSLRMQRAIAEVAEGRADQPEEAARWLSSFAGQGDLSQAAVMIGRAWARRNPTAAFAWAGTLPEEWRSPTQGRILRVLAWQNPRAALQMTNSISSAEGQRAALEEVRDTWLEKDPTAARLWLQNERPDLREKPRE